MYLLNEEYLPDWDSLMSRKLETGENTELFPKCIDFYKLVLMKAEGTSNAKSWNYIDFIYQLTGSTDELKFKNYSEYSTSAEAEE